MANLQSSTFARNLFLVYANLFIVLIMISVIVEKGQDVIFINQNHSVALDWFFSRVTVLGEGLLFVPVMAALLFIRFEFSLLTLFSWVGHGILCAFFKRVLFSDLGRPITFIDPGLLHFVPGVDVHRAFSFPSGHTATIFCLATMISLISKRPAVAVISVAMAFVVGYSRIYLLQHFLIDVTAGAVIGTATAFGCWALRNKFQSVSWAKQRLHVNVRSADERQVSIR